ncbi:pimeloyl-ACP methyl ester carboxylesterase [Actinokineospora baliensis]|uniref:alpha/beta fold hydrolase n=1 Tax=Actinokineospora baliensis TaxID=547056 RepID=UPI00195D70E6|nr:alpha/beta hydrolase [Actinokineospora baliensis]MBM7776299.1 pimeloyl-ACP methyl ester carboxylesterase [Actinokineospora baliensis]
MSVTEPPTAVLLPGTGSDEVFVRSVFAGPLAAVGVALRTPRPRPGKDLVKAHLAALDATEGPVLVGGISLGAHLGALWAAANPDRCAGLLLALPAWTGDSAGAPAALAARHSAADVRSRGLEAALSTAVTGVAPWLAAELTRAWRGYGPALADSLEAAADHPGPAQADLTSLTVPAGVASCTDDPIHPIETAQAWAEALPRAHLGTTSLSAMSTDVEALGRATVLAWLRARFER